MTTESEAQAQRSIGSHLKDARQRKSISFEDVHTKIKIHPRILQLLEDDKFDKLPSPLFAKSFIKIYAEFLELNPGELLEAYEKLGGKEPEQVLFIRPAEVLEKIKRRKALDRKLILMPVFIVGVVLFGASILWVYRTFTRSAESRSKIALKARSAARPDPSAPVKAKTDGWIRSVSQGNFPNLEKSSPLALKIKALDIVWLRVTCDGKVLFQSVLKKGSAETWTALSGVEIWTGNSANMALSLNGYSLGSPGRGVVKKLTITHQGVKIAS